jgi:uncharacterized membrane protein HdeD (DUF308 family)
VNIILTTETSTMSATDEQPLVQLQWDLAALRRKWAWFVLLGLLLILVGMFALAAQVIASLATAVVIGWLLLFAGVAEIVGAFFSRRWNGFFLHLLSGLLSAVVGVFFIWAPVDAALTLTLLLACLLIVGGTFKIIAASTYRFEGWGWPLASGIIDLILGVMIWLSWPASGLWVIGLFVGISLVFRGFNWIGLGMALHAGANVTADDLTVAGEIFPPSATAPPAQPGH